MGRIEQLRRLNRIQAATLVALLGLWLVGAGEDEKLNPAAAVKAQSFQLVDDADHVLAELGVDQKGTTGLFIKDAAGYARAMLVHGETGTALYLSDNEGTERVGVKLPSHGGAGFSLHGARSQGQCLLYYQKDGSLNFYDAKNAVIQRVPSGD